MHMEGVILLHFIAVDAVKLWLLLFTNNIDCKGACHILTCNLSPGFPQLAEIVWATIAWVSLGIPKLCTVG